MSDLNDNGFNEVVKPVIEWINNNANPHAKIIIECDSAELVQGFQSITTDEFLKD